MFDLGSEVDIWDRPVTINQLMDFRVLGAWRRDADHALRSLAVLFFKESLNGAEPIRLHDDIVIQKRQQVPMSRPRGIVHSRRFAASFNLQKGQRKRKTLGYAVQPFPGLILRIIICDNNLRLQFVQSRKFLKARQ
jgi:hypothetical protein